MFRLFFEGAPPVADPGMFFVGEVDLAWDGVWDRSWYSWTRWFETYDAGMFPELFSFSVAPLAGEQVAFGWAGGHDTGPLSAVLQVGRRTGNDEEAGQFDREIVLERLMRASYPNSGGIHLSVGSRSLAVVHDEWAQLFDFELNQIGHPVNFGTSTDSTNRTSLLYAGGFHAILETGYAGLPPEGDVEGGGADLAVSWIDEDARFVERTVLWCPTDGLPNPLPIDAMLMGSAWTGTGYWMVFEASEVYSDPYGLYVLYLPAP